MGTTNKSGSREEKGKPMRNKDIIVAGRILPKHLTKSAYDAAIVLSAMVRSGAARYMTRVQPAVVDLTVLPTPTSHKVDFKTFLANIGYTFDEKVVVLEFLKDVFDALNITLTDKDVVTVTTRMRELSWAPKAISTPNQVLSRIGVQISVNKKSSRNKTRWVNPIKVQQTLVDWVNGEVTNIPVSKVVTMANRYVMEIPVVHPSAQDSTDKVFEAPCYGRGYVVFDRDTLTAFMLDTISYEKVKGIVRVTQEVMASKLIVHDTETTKIGEVPFTTDFLDTLFLQGSAPLTIMGITTQADFDRYIKLAARKGLDTEFEYRLDKVTQVNKGNAKNKTSNEIAQVLDGVEIGETTIPTETRQQIGQTALKTNDGLEQVSTDQVYAYAGGSSMKTFLPEVKLGQTN